MLEQRISQDDKEVLIDMIREVSELFEKSNVTYIMYSGTLLGSYRHHALIPWDDDVDFQISINDKPKVVQALANLNKEYIFVQKYNLIWNIDVHLKHKGDIELNIGDNEFFIRR